MPGWPHYHAGVLAERCDELVRAAETADAVAFQTGIGKVWEAASGAGPDELNAALERICELFEMLPLGIAGRLAVLAGAMVEDGADPAPLVGYVVTGTGVAAETAAEFVTAWRNVVGEQAALPEPVEQQAALDAAMAALVRRHGWSRLRRGSKGVSEKEAYLLAEGWFSLTAWALPFTTLLQLKEVRGL